MVKDFTKCAVCKEVEDMDYMKPCRGDANSVCWSDFCSLYGTDEDPSLVTECEHKTALPDCKCKFCSVRPCPACNKEEISKLLVKISKKEAIVAKYDAAIAKNKRRLKRLNRRFKRAVSKKQVKAWIKKNRFIPPKQYYIPFPLCFWPVSHTSFSRNMLPSHAKTYSDSIIKIATFCF